MLRVFQSVRGLADDSVTRLDKNEDLVLEMKDLTETHRVALGMEFSCGQRETSSDANIAQVDYVLVWLGEFRD